MWNLPAPGPEVTWPTVRRFMQILSQSTPIMLLGNGLGMDQQFRPYVLSAGSLSMLAGMLNHDGGEGDSWPLPVPGPAGAAGAAGPALMFEQSVAEEDWPQVTAPVPANHVESGTYTPTLTNVANLDASTAYVCQYLRVGTVVTVSGKVDVDPTAGAASTQLGISLPIASNIGANEDCSGTAFASGIAGQGAAILGDATNNRAQMQWVSGDVTNQAMYFTFTYRII